VVNEAIGYFIFLKEMSPIIFVFINATQNVFKLHLYSQYSYYIWGGKCLDSSFKGCSTSTFIQIFENHKIALCVMGTDSDFILQCLISSIGRISNMVLEHIFSSFVTRLLAMKHMFLCKSLVVILSDLVYDT